MFTVSDRNVAQIIWFLAMYAMMIFAEITENQCVKRGTLQLHDQESRMVY